MNSLTVFTLLVAVVCVSALPTSIFPDRQYDDRCEILRLVEEKNEPIFETQEFRDCLKDKCKSNEVCCPKRTGGSKCVSVSTFDKLKIETPKFDKRCEALKIGEEPTFETQEFKDCLKNKCNNDEACCPKKTGGSKCVPSSTLSTPVKIDVSKYDPRCQFLKTKESIFKDKPIRDCVFTDLCGLTEVCCPLFSGISEPKVGTGKCVPDSLLSELSKNI